MSKTKKFLATVAAVLIEAPSVSVFASAGDGNTNDSKERLYGTPQSIDDSSIACRQVKERFEIPLSKLLTSKQFSEVERSCRIAEDALNDPQTYRFYRSNPELFAERYGIPIEKLDLMAQSMEFKVIDALADEDLRSHAGKEDLPGFLKKLQEKGILPD